MTAYRLLSASGGGVDEFSRSALARSIKSGAVGKLEAARLGDGLPPLLWQELLGLADRAEGHVAFARLPGSFRAEQVVHRRRGRLIRRLAEQGDLAGLLVEAGLSPAQVVEVLDALGGAPAASQADAIELSRRLDEVMDQLVAIRRDVRVGEPLPLALTGRRRAILVCAGIALLATLAEMGSKADLRGASAGLAIYLITRGLLDPD